MVIDNLFFEYYVLSKQDYSPFGMMMEGRHSAVAYRYGFQGQEQDNEIKGDANSLNYEYRMHDPRLGRFFALDPLAPKYPHNSPYAFSENRVIDGIELEGLEVVPINEVWQISGGTLATASSGDVDYTGPYKVGTYGDEKITLHEITSGPNKGNYKGIVHNGDYRNFFYYKNGNLDKLDPNYTFEEKYIFGADRVPETAVFKIEERNQATDGLIWAIGSNYEYSASLAWVTYINYLLKTGPLNGYWDEMGEFVSTTTASDIVEYWWGEIKNPYNWLAAAHAMNRPFMTNAVDLSSVNINLLQQELILLKIQWPYDI